MNLAVRARIENIREKFLQSNIRLPLLIWLYSRIFYYTSAFIAAKILDIHFSLRIFRLLDAGWYLSIIKDGYMHEVVSSGPEVGRANWAFFPAMPLLVRILSTVSQVKILWVAYLVSNIALLVGLYFLYRYLIRDFSSTVAKTTLIFIAISPVNVYFTTVYTESLFFALLMATIFYTREHRWIAAGICGAFLTGTRNTGIFMIAIYILEFVRSPDLRNSVVERRRFLCGLLIFPTGLIAFMLYLANVANDPLAFYHIQSAWGNPQPSLLTYLASFLENRSISHILNFAVLCIAITTCIYLFRKRLFLDFIVLFPITLISLITLRIQYRFYFALYPIYLVAAILTQRKTKLVKVFFMIEALVLVVAIKLWITGFGPT